MDTEEIDDKKKEQEASETPAKAVEEQNKDLKDQDLESEAENEDEPETEPEEEFDSDEGIEEEEIRKVGSDTNESIAFYPPPPKKKSRKTLYLIIVLILILATLGFLFRHQIKSLFSVGPAPTPTPTATPAPSPTPEPLSRTVWSLEVLNGTSTSGQAKKVADKLKELGYPVVKVGNADKQNYPATQILVKKDLLSKVDLVVADLKDIIKIASVAGELKEGTASARIIIGKDY